MKNVIFTLSMLFITMLGFNATAQVGGVPVGGAVDGPVIKVDKEIHDYGTIENGANGMCVFKVTNTGNQPLIISTCSGSCGCTVPKCPETPILPGASSEITVKYDTEREGPINKSVTINSNAANNPALIIKIKGNVKAKKTATSTPPAN